METRNQITILFAVSLLLAASVNSIRPSGGITWKSIPIKSVKEAEDVLNILEPVIREIDLELAISLHDKGLLFIDARAEEYLVDGYIPNAIADDDFDSLTEKINSLIGLDNAFVVYCSDDDCGSSEELAYDLQEWGFNNILVFKGGWKSWVDARLKKQFNE